MPESEKRELKVNIPAYADSVRVLRAEGTEQLGRPFELRLDLRFEGDAFQRNDLLGEPLDLTIDVVGESERVINGVITALRPIERHADGLRVRVTVRPWIARLALRARSRIFQNLSVPDIIKSVFREIGGDLRESLSGSYPVHEYRVQYRETDLDFVTRLMEERGIYYFFEHEPGRHVLVLADSSMAHSKSAGNEALPYYPPTESSRRERTGFWSWTSERQLRPRAVLVDDFDYLRPKAALEAKRVGQEAKLTADDELYDYPGGYSVTSDGESLARTRLEVLDTERLRGNGEGDALGLAVGETFALEEHPDDAENVDQLVIAASFQASTRSGRTGDQAVEHAFVARVETIPASIPFRLPPTTTRPFVRGPQTAIVVGPAGKEIWTDEHGRVKLQFHWDREGRSDEVSSCWVRVSQVWAGAGWGAIHIPRIGHEVIVDFLEGDPDRPLITGRLYNGANPPPYALPDNATQSGIVSRSSEGGGASNFNELRFEDKKGSEQVYLQAEKDLEFYVKNDERRTVDHDRFKTVKNDETVVVEGARTETVKKDETITVEGARTETVKKDETITVEGARTETVKKDETITVEGARTETVKKDETITVEGARTETVKKDETITVEGARTETVKKDETVTVEGARKETVKGDETITVEGARSETVKGAETVTITGARTIEMKASGKLDAAQKLELLAGQELVLKVGAASITLKASGEIILKGVNVKVEAAAIAEVKAGAMLKLAAPAIKQG